MPERVSARAIYDLLIEHKRPGDGLPDPLDATLLANAKRLYDAVVKFEKVAGKYRDSSEVLDNLDCWGEVTEAIERIDGSIYDNN
jgi:hypothetical protein